ncbi:MAG: hypothetical protein SVZ03_14765 [Spirochaetota bacterium]|nr:hypothetical protein [Spirochaetota bacterium]
MPYFQDQVRWLEIAKECEPQLYHNNIRPQSLVRSIGDPRSFQGWRMLPKLPPASIYQRRLKRGDQLILDFGEHIVGYLHFTLNLIGEAMGGPLRIKFIFGEVPAEVCEPFDPFIGTLSRAWLQDETITLDTLPQSICLSRRFAFRYLKIEIMAASFDYQIQFSSIHCDSVTSASIPIEKLCNKRIKPEFQNLDIVGLRTLRNCMQTGLEDGPKRDRRLWIGDSPLLARTNYLTFKNYTVVKRGLYLFAGLAHENGQLPACVYERPVFSKGNEFILGHAALYTSSLLDYAEASGDWETARDLWPIALKQMDFVMEYINNDYIFQDIGKWWIFVDWRPELDIQTPMQGIIIFSLKRLSELAQAIDKEAEAAFARELINKMTIAARERMLSPSHNNLFVSGSKRQISWASQVWMILSGVISPQEGAILFQKLIKRKDAVKPATPFIYHYAVEAMLTCGLKELAIELINLYWGGMINAGASTFWEIYDPTDPFLSPYANYLLNSYCHAWSCTPSYFFRKWNSVFEV